MAREVMRRQAADNEYRHPDFHGALSTALEYLHRQYGEQAVREYLHRFARAYYAPLTAAIAREGLAPLRAHLEAVFPAYSELFRYLEERGGKEAVLDFWHYLSDNFLGNLRDLVQEHGLRGCWLYWSHTLNEEAADFTMILDEEAGEFSITMRRCPSKGRLLATPHLTPYPDYCRHCNVLYRRVLEPLGYEYRLDMSGCSEARCRVEVRRVICRRQ